MTTETETTEQSTGWDRVHELMEAAVDVAYEQSSFMGYRGTGDDQAVLHMLGQLQACYVTAGAEADVLAGMLSAMTLVSLDVAYGMVEEAAEAAALLLPR